MLKKQIAPMVFSALLLASPLAMAEEAHHPEQAGEESAPASTAIAPATEALGDAAPGTDPGTTEGSGMMRPGMSGQGGGMMMPGMMGGMQGMGGRPGGGMMKGGQRMGCKMHQGMKAGHGMMQKHRDVVSRLDLIDARLIKIEAMLERLMQR